jgi:hypothetical protein
MRARAAGWLRAGVLALAGVAMCSCDPTAYLEGCEDRATALHDLGLQDVSTQPLELSGLRVRLPASVLYRLEARQLVVLSEPGVFCDSGDWGMQRSNYLRLRIHDDAPPDDPFSDFPSDLRGWPLEQIERGIGSIDYELRQNALTWRIRVHLGNPFLPRTRLLYAITDVPLDGRRQGVSIHYFPGDAEPGAAVLTVLLASIEESTRAAR